MINKPSLNNEYTTEARDCAPLFCFLNSDKDIVGLVFIK